MSYCHELLHPNRESQLHLGSPAISAQSGNMSVAYDVSRGSHIPAGSREEGLEYPDLRKGQAQDGETFQNRIPEDSRFRRLDGRVISVMPRMEAGVEKGHIVRKSSTQGGKGESAPRLTISVFCQCSPACLVACTCFPQVRMYALLLAASDPKAFVSVLIRP